VEAEDDQLGLYTALRNSSRKAVNQGRCLIRKSANISENYPGFSPPSRALAWIRANEVSTGGIRTHSNHSDAYPEVSGYIIPTLLNYGERDLAKRLIQWLLCIQRADGSYTSPNGVPHVFDTGQILRGLLAGAELVPEALDAAERAANYLRKEMLGGGSEGFGNRYSEEIPETVHLYVLPPLMKAAHALGKPEFVEAVEHCTEYYCGHADFLKDTDLTHFLGYEVEALIDLGHMDKVFSFLTKLGERQDSSGSLGAKNNSSWICTPGLAQLALCWYKIGQWQPADKALDWLEYHQNSTGGFSGSYGKGASYFRDVEIPWAAKFYLDANRLRIGSFFNRNASVLPSSVSKDDGRVRAILSVVRPTDRILEVGCGKGRFLKAIRETHPTTDCTGVDISPALLKQVSVEIRTVQGSLESIPLPGQSFDVVFAVEAIEHSANPKAAIAEMIRVARPGGWVLVIDKHRSQWGRLTCPPWEQWPEKFLLQSEMNKGCDHVSTEPVGYDGNPPSDGLMVFWRGQKRSRLSGKKWNEALLSPSSHRNLVNRVRSNHLSEWCQVLVLATRSKDKVLEIGTGTGEMSLHLSQTGRKVTALDFSMENLQFVKQCADELGICLEVVMADATQLLPFPDNSFDCVWSSGLLEHFSSEQRCNMLREQGRVSNKKVISLVPNASCIAYRAGKAYQEEQGKWPYGLEIPIPSMRKEFEAAGLHVTSEFSVGARHALSFLPGNHLLRKPLETWIKSVSLREVGECNQGYLLVTTGLKISEK
jgi:malonyl-CoA O-methyltransferase